MSAGAVFKLIANDGKADKMILATELLSARLKSIMCSRAQAGYPDPTPTLLDIERTHALFVNAHFKPYAAIGYEYNKVRANTGVSQYGSTVQFSIAQFGDFFCDMVVNTVLQQTQATVGVVPAFPPYVGGIDQALSATSSVSAVSDTINGIYTKYTYEYVDSQDNVKTVGSAASNFVRYAEYPGQRLFKKIKFEVNGNPLDDYTAETYMFYEKHRVLPHKKTAYKRLFGQEVPVEAYTDLLSISGSSNYPSAVTDLVNSSANAAPGGPYSASQNARKVVQIVNGPQTPKAVQPTLDLWIPLIFWFNLNPQLAVPSIAIPYGQRFILIELDDQRRILFTAPGNLFLKFTVEQQYSNHGTKGTAAALQVFDVKKYVTRTPVLAVGSTIDSTQSIPIMDLYVNNIFVNPEIHDIYIKRIGFSLIRVHRQSTNRVTVASDNILLNQLKWPIEGMRIALRPTVNIDPSNPTQYRDWHRLTQVEEEEITTPAISAGDVMTDDTVAFNAAISGATAYKHKKFSSQGVAERYSCPIYTETVDSLSLEAHGIAIYQQFKSAFFRDYLGYTFGSDKSIAPEDPGLYLMFFALHPGTYQPSGHINVSRAREFYLKFSSSYVNSNQPADLLIDADAINFLLISDGSAVLRYTT